MKPSRPALGCRVSSRPKQHSEPSLKRKSEKKAGGGNLVVVCPMHEALGSILGRRGPSNNKNIIGGIL